MNPELQQKLILALVDKLLLGLVAGAVLLLGQYLISQAIEHSRSQLAYKRAVAEARIAHLQNAWHGIHAYGVEIAGLLRGSAESTKTEDIMKCAQDFDEKLSRCGIFLGRKKVEDIKSRLGGAFLFKLVEELRDPNSQNFKKMLTQFQADWMSVLDELQKELDKQV